ncbi:MAG: methionyl-tRNA formyltransferase, partial [Gracilibacteraceae bacterium]|nr:methionyl-tRNA formyltransferase [Gracilibacteraceae bacterium]
VKELALALGLDIFQPNRLQEAVAALRDLRPELIAVVAYGQMLPPEILSLPPGGCVNLHASLLPLYRGAAPIQRALLNGETRTGVTTMRMDAGMDTGDILLQCGCSIPPGEDMGGLHDKLAPLGAELLAETLRRLEDGALTARPQGDGATYAPLLRRADERLVWTESAVSLARRVRALRPRPGAFTQLGSETLKVWTAEARPGGTAAAGASPAPGEILRFTAAGLLCAAGSGELELISVQPAGRGRMAAADFARGRRLDPGDRFGP